MLVAVIPKRTIESECVHKRLAGGQAAIKAAYRVFGHGMRLLAGVLPAHRLPDCNRDRRRREGKVVRGGHRDGCSAVGARVGRGACGITAGHGRKGQKGEEREADAHGQEPQVGGPQAVARTYITILRQNRARRLTECA